MTTISSTSSSWRGERRCSGRGSTGLRRVGPVVVAPSPTPAASNLGRIASASALQAAHRRAPSRSSRRPGPVAVELEEVEAVELAVADARPGRSAPRRRRLDLLGVAEVLEHLAAPSTRIAVTDRVPSYGLKTPDCGRRRRRRAVVGERRDGPWPPRPPWNASLSMRSPYRRQSTGPAVQHVRAERAAEQLLDRGPEASSSASRSIPVSTPISSSIETRSSVEMFPVAPGGTGQPPSSPKRGLERARRPARARRARWPGPGRGCCGSGP